METIEIVLWNRIGDTVSGGYVVVGEIVSGRMNVPNGTTICLRGQHINPIGKRVVLTEKKLDFAKALDTFKIKWLEEYFLRDTAIAARPDVENRPRNFWMTIKSLLAHCKIIKNAKGSNN